jgi:hypothetical protein
MANVGIVATAKGEMLTNAHIASLSRADQGYYVISGCDCNQAGTPAMSVVVDSGYVQVAYSTERKTVTGGTLTVATADATYPRIDVIYVNTSGTISIYAGTPTAISPSSKTDFKQMATPAPGSSIPNGVILALVYVGPGVTSILNAQILDIASYGPYCVEAPTSATTSGYVPQWSSTAKTLGTGLGVVTAIDATGYDTNLPTEQAVRESLTTVINALNVRTIGLVMDNGGYPLVAGTIYRMKVDYGGTIQTVELVANQTGSIVIDIWKKAYASLPATVSDTITASAKPTLSSALTYQDVTLSGWTKTITAGDYLYFKIDSATTVTAVTISLKVQVS